MWIGNLLTFRQNHVEDFPFGANGNVSCKVFSIVEFSAHVVSRARVVVGNQLLVVLITHRKDKFGYKRTNENQNFSITKRFFERGRQLKVILSQPCLEFRHYYNVSMKLVDWGFIY